jgi:hypothetical protein
VFTARYALSPYIKQTRFACKGVIQLQIVTKHMVEICSSMDCYAAWNGCSVSTFRDDLSIPSSRVKKCKKKRNKTTTPRCVMSQKSAYLMYVAAEASNHVNLMVV